MKNWGATLTVVSVLFVAGCSASVDEPEPAAGVTNEYMTEMATELAMSLGITDPPEVNIENVISLTECGPTQASCLQEAGFDVSLYGDGELLTCLAAERYGIESRPPSVSVFVQSDGLWNPYNELTHLSANTLGQLYVACPWTDESIYDMR